MSSFGARIARSSARILPLREVLEMTRSRALLVLLLAALPVLGCSSGDECDTCTEDADCQEGFLCTTFSDGSRRCGSGVGATTCRTR
jgi:hypothetical protein